jgi:hypothetical protein
MARSYIFVWNHTYIYICSKYCSFRTFLHAPYRKCSFLYAEMPIPMAERESRWFTGTPAGRSQEKLATSDVRPWHHAGPAASSSVSITPTPNLINLGRFGAIFVAWDCDIVQMKDQQNGSLETWLSDLAQLMLCSIDHTQKEPRDSTWKSEESGCESSQDGEPMESWKESVQMAMAAMGVPQSSHQNLVKWSLNPSPVQLKSLLIF